MMILVFDLGSGRFHKEPHLHKHWAYSAYQEHQLYNDVRLHCEIVKEGGANAPDVSLEGLMQEDILIKDLGYIKEVIYMFGYGKNPPLFVTHF